MRKSSMSAAEGASGADLSAHDAVHAASERMRSWWTELTRPTRVLVAVNAAVTVGVCALAAMLPVIP